MDFEVGALPSGGLATGDAAPGPRPMGPRLDAADRPSLSQEAFRPWLAGMRPRLHRYCARMMGSVIDGEDVVQETVLKALGAADRIESVTAPQAWLFRIAHNVARDALRRRARGPIAITPEALEMIEDAGAGAESRTAVAMSVRTFMQLTPAQRAAVVLKDVLGHSLDEICAITGATLPATKAALHKARARLRRLAQAADGPPIPAKPLDPRDRALLEAYVDRFNARDFEAVTAMLARDVRVRLVGDKDLLGRAEVESYLGNYSRATNWRVAPGLVEGTPAALYVSDLTGEVAHFALVDWVDGRVSRVRDYRYAAYVLSEADVAPLAGPTP